jgi:sugar phosphate isomerase/epimerase
MEWGVSKLLVPNESEDVFLAALEKVKAAKLPFEACTGFIPGDLKITGPEVDSAALEAYVTTAMTRARHAGVDTIVFGSGGARRIPDGFDPNEAHEQIVTFCRMVAPLAQDNGVTVVVEPLNTAQCNVLTSVAESADLVNEVDHPGLRLLADIYHMMRDDDPADDLSMHGHLLKHMHIATKDNRCVPGDEPCDFADHFKNLSDAKYDGRMSIEAGASDDTDWGAARALLDNLLK